MSTDVSQCQVMSITYNVIMNMHTSDRHKVTWCCYNYLGYLSLYVFICTLMSMYTQHYGGRHA